MKDYKIPPLLRSLYYSYLNQKLLFVNTNLSRFYDEDVFNIYAKMCYKYEIHISLVHKAREYLLQEVFLKNHDGT